VRSILIGPGFLELLGISAFSIFLPRHALLDAPLHERPSKIAFRL
jgi:hypothetical protein